MAFAESLREIVPDFPELVVSPPGFYTARVLIGRIGLHQMVTQS